MCYVFDDFCSLWRAIQISEHLTITKIKKMETVLIF